MNMLFGYPGHECLIPDIVRAENCYLYDTSGQQYLDLESGVWCTGLGHGHPRIVRALKKQAGLLSHTGFGFNSPVTAKAAQTVTDLHGFENGKTIFLSSGSEAVEFGIRVLETVYENPCFLTMADSYFGAYGSAHEKTASQWTLFDWTPCKSCTRTDECDHECPVWANVPFDRISAFVFEPGSASGLVGFPPDHLVRSIAHQVKSIGGLVMVNEVTTGMGRTAKWFGYQHYDLIPDIVAMGKGLGNGYPVSATLVSEHLTSRLPGSGVAYGQSHQNDPLGAAVALAVIDTIQSQGLIDRAGHLSSILLKGLERIKESSGRILQVRGRGLMAAIELEDGSQGTLEVWRKLIDQGFVLSKRPGLSVLRLDPALTIEPDDLKRFLDTFAQILEEKS